MHLVSKRKKRKNDRTLHASSEPVVDTPENPNDISISNAETQSGDEHEPSDNVNDNVHAQRKHKITFILGSTLITTKKKTHP